MNDHSTTHSGSARALCSRCGRLVEMTRFVDPRLLDERPLEERLHEWDPNAPLAPTVYKCTRCGHEARASAIAA